MLHAPQQVYKRHVTPASRDLTLWITRLNLGDIRSGIFAVEYWHMKNVAAYL
jgi:hypothetical protein